MSGWKGVKLQYGDSDQWLKLLILLYAGGTLVISHNPVDIQYTLNQFADNCVEWKLKVNLLESKVINWIPEYLDLKENVHISFFA